MAGFEPRGQSAGETSEAVGSGAFTVTSSVYGFGGSIPAPINKHMELQGVLVTQ